MSQKVGNYWWQAQGKLRIHFRISYFQFTSSLNVLCIYRDMTIQIVKLNESSTPPVKIDRHTAPILSVRIDPKEEHFVSTACDGSVCIWNLEGKQVKAWDGVFPSSNDISISKTLCRPSWIGDGKLIAIPIKNEVKLYSSSGWKEVKVLKSSQENKVRQC